MTIIFHKGKQYKIAKHRLSIIGDLFISPQGKVHEAKNLAELEVLSENFDLLEEIKPIPEQVLALKNLPAPEKSVRDTFRKLAHS